MISRAILIIICCVAAVVIERAISETYPDGTVTQLIAPPTSTPLTERWNVPSPELADIPTQQPSPEKLLRTAEKDWIKSWQKLVLESHIQHLENAKLTSDDIEIRVWQVPGLFARKTKCWIFARTDGEWKGFAIVDRESSGRVTRLSLDGPNPESTEWSNYVDNDLSPENIRDAAKNVTYEGPEGEFFVVESKFGNEYVREMVANEAFVLRFLQMVRSEFFRNDDSKWATF